MSGPSSAVLGAAKTAIETAKYVATAVKEYDKAELKLKAVELIQQITELALSNSELHQTVNELRKEIADMKKLAELREQVYVVGNSYYRRIGDRNDGPFCFRCLDVDGILVRCQEFEYGMIICGHCQLLKK